VAKGQYLIVEDAELEAIEIESTHTIEIDRFVPHSGSTSASSIALIMSCQRAGRHEAFAVIREAHARQGMVALGRASALEARAGDRA